jgi:hypothetical protein
VKHTIVARDDGFRLGRLVWNDETGEVDGDHTKASDLADAIGNGPMTVPSPFGDLNLADPAHDPSDFLTALRHVVFWPLHIELPASLSNVAPTPYPPPPHGLDGVIY